MKKEKNHKKRYFPAAIAAAAVLALTSVTAYAAWRYLSAGEVASELSNRTLADAFSDSNVISEEQTQSCGGYDVTLLGVVSGDKISDFLNKDDAGNIDGDKTYVAVAIAKSDQTPMPGNGDADFDPTAIFVSPYIKGLNPKDYNAYSLGGGFSCFVKDGVQYRILETDNIEAFADRTVYIGASDGSIAYNVNAYRYDETTGELSRNPDYEGLNALFVIQLDPAKADSAKAQQMIAAMDGLENVGGSYSLFFTEEDLWVNSITPENIDEKAVPYEESRQILTIDEDGYVTLPDRYEYGDGLTQKQPASEEKLPGQSIFRNGPGMSDMIGRYSYSERIGSAYVSTVTLNEDGTVTYLIYVPKEN